MTKAIKCPRCDSTKVDTLIIDGIPDESGSAAHLGEFLVCSKCKNKWRPPEEPDFTDTDELITVILPTIRNN